MEQFLESHMRGHLEMVTVSSDAALDTEANASEMDNITFESNSESQICQDINPFWLQDRGWIPENVIHGSMSLYSVFSVFLSFLLVVALTTNILLVLTLKKFKEALQPIDYILANIAVVDMLRVVLRGSLTIWYNGKGYIGRKTCQLDGFFGNGLSVTGTYAIIVIAVERSRNACASGNVASTGEGGSRSFLFNVTHALAANLLCWIWSFGWSGALMSNGYAPEGAGTHCAPNWDSGDSRMFVILFFIFCFAIPLVIVALACLKLNSVSRQVIENDQPVDGIISEADMTKSLLVATAVFLIFRMPYCLFAMCSVFNVEVDPTLMAFAEYISLADTFFKPIIYVKFGSRFRDMIIRFICKDGNPWLEREMGFQMSSMCSKVSTVASKKE